MVYSEYLLSDHWKSLRGAAVSCQPYCGACNSKHSLNAHHLIYRRSWYDSVAEDLLVLCGRCHANLHKLIDSGRFDLLKSKPHYAREITIDNLRRMLGFRKKKDSDKRRFVRTFRSGKIRKRAALLISNSSNFMTMFSKQAPSSPDCVSNWNLILFLTQYY